MNFSTDPDSQHCFQVEIMKLVLSLVMLEEILFQKKFEDADRPRNKQFKLNSMNRFYLILFHSSF